MHKLLEMGEPSELELLRQRVEDLEDEVKTERAKVVEARSQSIAASKALARLRSQLQPWYSALRAVMGELDAAGIDSGEVSTSSPSQPVSEAAYSAWKTRLPPSCGRIIEALLVQPLSHTQMVTICKMHYNTIANALVILRKNSLIDKKGNLYRLRRL